MLNRSLLIADVSLYDLSAGTVANLRKAERLYVDIQHSYMERFCTAYPNHLLTKNYLSKKSKNDG